MKAYADKAVSSLKQAASDASTNRWFWPALAFALLIYAVDQASKYWILYVFELPAKQSVSVLPFFNLSMVWNEGVSFGLLAGANARVLLSVFSGIVALGLIYWLASLRRPLLAFAVGGVIGGAIGNLTDRIIHGAVVDFFDFSALYFPWVFNVADSAISVGVVFILLDAILTPEVKASAKSQD
ncbi:MAG: signal peptidase II [Pseudomonadota bacterium]